MSSDDLAVGINYILNTSDGAAKAHRWYRGEQETVIDDDIWSEAFQESEVDQPRDNMGELAVNTIVSRMRPERFIARLDTPENEEAAEQAARIAKLNRWDQFATTVHREGRICGSAAVQVGVNRKGQAVFFLRPGGTFYIDYDPEYPGLIRYVVTRVVDGDVTRYRVWYDDIIELWEVDSKKADTLQGSSDPGTRIANSCVLIEQADNPTGRCPFFEFSLDKSDMEKLYRMQPALDLAFADLLMISHNRGYPLHYITGAKMDTGEENTDGIYAGMDTTPDEPDELPTRSTVDPSLTVGPSHTLVLEDPQAKVGAVPAAELEGTLRLLDNIRTAILRTFTLPPHLGLLQTGDFPTGKALKTAEAQFVAMVEDICTIWGNVWEDLFAFAVQCENSHNADGSFNELADLPELELQWRDPRTEEGLSAEDRLRVLVDTDVPLRYVLQELGYSEAEALEVEELRAAAAARATEQRERALLGGAA